MSELDQYLMPTNSPINMGTTVSAYQVDSLYEDSSIRTAGIQGSAVIDSKMGTFSAGKITAGTIVADVAYAGTLTANQLNGGTLTLGGTVNGNGVMQIKNAAGTTIVQGDNLGHHYYGTSGTQELIRVDSTGLHALNTGGTTLYEIKADGFFAYGTTSDVIQVRETSSTANSYGFLGYTTSSGNPYFYILTGDSKGLFIQTSLKAFVVSSTDLNLIAGTDATLTADNDMFIVCDANDNASGAMYFKNYNSRNYRFWDKNNGVYRTLTMDSDKTAIMPTRDGYKALYCVESPEVWFMDFVEKKDHLDPYFEDVTIPPYKYIQCDDGTYQVWGKRKGKEDKRFEPKSVSEFIENDKFWSQAQRPSKPDYSNLISKLSQYREEWGSAEELEEYKYLEKNIMAFKSTDGERVEVEEPIFVSKLRKSGNPHPLKEVAMKKIDDVVEK